MHVIKVIKNPKAEEYRSVCEEDDFVSNLYGTEQAAKEKGLKHKEIKDGNPDARN
jgi:hypothetical protein